MSDLLNGAQRSSLAIALRMFEEELRRAASWLEMPPEQGILYRRTLRLPPEARAAVRQSIAAALAEIAGLAQEFGLAPEEQDLATAIAAAMSLSWANLCDARSDKLRRFGDVHPALAEALDPRLEQLAELALSLASRLRSDDASP